MPGRSPRRRDGRSREKAGSAAGRHDDVEVRDLLEKLERRSPLPGDDRLVVERRHQDDAPLLDEPPRDRLAVLAPAVVEDDLGAVAARGGELQGRRVVGHDDRRGHAEVARRERHGLRVVPGGEGDDAPRPARPPTGA